MRTADAVLQLITGIDVVNNFCFLPRQQAQVDAAGLPLPSAPVTFCNCYVTCCTAALGCAIAPMKANKQHQWLKSSEAQLAGWMHVDSETARQRAQLGYPTVAAWTNPTGGHGHIALCVPADPTGPVGVYVSAAGSQNFVRALQQRSFGSYVPEYFTHA